ncbi:MAG: hypothetical protein WEC80_02520 [Patescibacteria group bacterium]
MKILFAILFFLVVMPKTTLAYLDPGSGSYLLQMILGIFLGGAYFFRSFFKGIKDKLVDLLKKVFKKK